MDGNSIYLPLNNSRQEIRLLDIIATTPEIVCKLSTVSLQDNPKFYALSYVWGNGNERDVITIDDVRKSVTTNLARAIRDVCYHWNQIITSEEAALPHRLWADAVCINQGDVEEKNHQIPLMGTIYSSAVMVLAWIGPPSEIIHQSFEFCETVTRETSSYSAEQEGSVEWMERYMTEDPGGTWFWDSMIVLTQLFTYPYWTRVWTFQEIVLAQEALLISGTEALNLDTLRDATIYFQAAEKRYTHTELPDHFGFYDKLALQGAAPYIVGRIGHGKQHVFHQWSLLGQIKDHEEAQELSTRKVARNGFAMHHQTEMYYQATDPKDLIYGLLGVTGIQIEPDYSTQKTAASVYCDFVAQWFRDGLCNSGDDFEDNICDLWFLSDAGVGYTFSEACPNIPSWAPNMIGISIARTEDDKNRVFPYYDADSDIFADCTQGPSLLELGLHCPVVALESINYIGQRVRSDEPFVSLLRQDMLSCFRACLSRSRRYQPSGGHKIAAIVCLFLSVVWKNYKGLNELHVAWLIYELAGGKLTALDHLEADEIFSELNLSQFRENEEGASPGEWSRKVFTELFLNLKKEGNVKYDYYHAVLKWKGLRFAETQNGYIGLFPPLVAEGDILCILKGCSVPVVLRKVRSQYLHVGTCYVFGLMNGEAKELVTTSQAKIEMAEII